VLQKIVAAISERFADMWFFTLAYLLMRQVREVALSGTRLARAIVGTTRLRLMKNAAQVTASVRRVHVRLHNANPMHHLC
jgi:DDE family transposase